MGRFGIPYEGFEFESETFDVMEYFIAIIDEIDKM